MPEINQQACFIFIIPFVNLIGVLGGSLKREIGTRCRFEWKLSIQFPCSLRYATSQLSFPWVFLPVCLNAVPTPVSGGVVLLISSQNHIPFSRSFSCNRHFGQQKSRHTNVYRLIKRLEFPLGVLVSHSCNRL